MDEYCKYDVKTHSPSFIKKTPKFNNTLKKNITSELRTKNTFYQEQNKPSAIKYISTTQKKSKTLMQPKLKSKEYKFETDEELGFLKNSVEIINPNQNSRRLSHLKSWEKENSSSKQPIKRNIEIDQKNPLKESNKFNMKITIPTTESLLLENINQSYFNNHAKIKNDNKFIHNSQQKQTKDQNYQSEFINIVNDMGLSINQNDGETILHDKTILNNLNMLCIIQKNLHEIAKRKKEYLIDLLKKKSFSIDSHNIELQNYQEDSRNHPQSPIDDFINPESQKSIKAVRSLSFSEIQNKMDNAILANKRENCKTFRNTTRKKLKTVDFDDYIEENQTSEKECRNDSHERQQNANSIAELLKMLSIKHNTQEKKINNQNDTSSLFLEEEESIAEYNNDSYVNQIKGGERFLREFMINYPLSKKKLENFS